MAVQYLTLLSNAPSAGNFKNTLTHFKTRLVKPLETVSPLNHWAIALHSVSIAKRTHYVSKKQLLVHIRCAQVNGAHFGDTTLSVHALTKKGNHTFEPKHKFFFDCIQERLEDIEIEISSLQLENKLFTAQPTVVVLQLKEVNTWDAMQGLQVLHLSSAGALSEGTPTSFQCQISPGLIASRRSWDLALASITFNSCFKMFRGNQDGVIKVHFHQAKVRTVMEVDTDLTDFGGQKADNAIPVKLLNDRSNETIKLIALIKRLMNDLNIGPRRVLECGYEAKKDRFKFIPHMEGNLYIPFELASAMGHSLDRPDANGNVRFTFDKASLNKPYYFAKDSIDFEASAPKDLLLYSSVIETSQVGSEQAPLLKSFPVKAMSNVKELYSYEAQDLEYHRIKYEDVNALRFDLLTTFGTQPAFQNPNCVIQMTIVLRATR